MRLCLPSYLKSPDGLLSLERVVSRLSQPGHATSTAVLLPLVRACWCGVFVVAAAIAPVATQFGLHRKERAHICLEKPRPFLTWKPFAPHCQVWEQRASLWVELSGVREGSLALHMLRGEILLSEKVILSMGVRYMEKVGCP